MRHDTDDLMDLSHLASLPFLSPLFLEKNKYNPNTCIHGILWCRLGTHTGSRTDNIWDSLQSFREVIFQ